MKRRLLPATDLARIAPRSVRDKRIALEAFELGDPTFSYRPVASSVADIFDASGSLLESAGRTGLVEIVRAIRRARMSEFGIEQNLKIAHALVRFSTEFSVQARQVDLFPATLGAASQLAYWSNLVLLIDGKLHVFYLDFRNTRRLDDEGRLFAYSVQNEFVRAAGLGLETAELSIFQFATDGETRDASLFVHDGERALYSYSELVSMTDETYRIWDEVCYERAMAKRKFGGGGGGLL